MKPALLRLASATSFLLTSGWAMDAAAANPPALQAVGELRSALDQDMCVDIATPSPDFIVPLTNIHLWGCHGGDNQTWYMTMTGELRSAQDPGICLETWNGNIWAQVCNGESWQRWDLTESGELRSEWSPDKCVDVELANTGSGTNIQLYTCNGTKAQQFQIARLPWAAVHSGLHDNRCMDVEDGSQDYAANVISWECHDGDNQAWYLTPTGELRSGVAANRCLDVPNNEPYSGQNLRVWGCNDTAAQKWKLGEDGQIHYAANDNYCIDVSDGSSAMGANIQLYACNGSPAQQWTSTSFASFELAEVDGAPALVWTTGGEGYALTDPVAMLQLLEQMGYDDASLDSLYDAMSVNQRDHVNQRMGALDKDLIALAEMTLAYNPMTHIVDNIGGSWWFSDSSLGLNASLWGANVSASVGPNTAVLSVEAAGLKIVAKAGIVSIDNVFDADIDGSFSLDGSQPIGFSLQLSVFQVDLYITGFDIEGTFEDVAAFSDDASAWTEQAAVDTVDWFDGAAKDSVNWTVGAATTLDNAIQDVFDEIFGWF